jgi:hypothetical protein
MRAETLKEEAAECRRRANEFVGRPEEPFLLQLASALEELAIVQARVEAISECSPIAVRSGVATY